MNSILDFNECYRSRVIGKYFVDTQSTVRETAKHFGIGKSTVHTILTKDLKRNSSSLYNEVRKLLDKNKAERTQRGGASTRAKWRLKKMEEVG